MFLSGNLICRANLLIFVSYLCGISNISLKYLTSAVSFSPKIAAKFDWFGIRYKFQSVLIQAYMKAIASHTYFVR